MYSPSKTKASILRTREIVLQVTRDSAYKKGYATEADVIARTELQNDGAQFRLRFSAPEKGAYHLSYGPGEGGFIFHLVPDNQLPTEVVTVRGEIRDHTKLVAINSVVIGPKPLSLGGSWQVCFPCKVVPQKANTLGVLKGTRVPLSEETAANVSRFGSAIMHPIMMRYMQMKLDTQAKQIQLLQSK